MPTSYTGPTSDTRESGGQSCCGEDAAKAAPRSEERPPEAKTAPPIALTGCCCRQFLSGHFAVPRSQRGSRPDAKTPA